MNPGLVDTSILLISICPIKRSYEKLKGGQLSLLLSESLLTTSLALGCLIIKLISDPIVFPYAA